MHYALAREEKTVYEYAVFYENGCIVVRNFNNRREANEFYDANARDPLDPVRSIFYNHPNGPEFVAGLIAR